MSMTKGKARLIRNDSVLKIKERLFRLKGDDTKYIAMTTRSKGKKNRIQPHALEYWVGYYTSDGQQRGLGGFYHKKKDIPKKYVAAFQGLSIPPTRRKK